MQLLDKEERAAAAWIAARRLARAAVGDMPAELKPRAEDAGYRIQAHVVARLSAAGGGRQVGWKVGVTTPQMRAYLGIDAPIAGALLAGGRLGSGASLRHADYARIGIECEIAMVLGAPLGGGAIGAATAAAAVTTLHPAIELVDDRYGGSYRDFGVPAIVADNAFHAGFVLGPGVAAWREIDLGAVRGVTRSGGVVRVEGRGADVQGHPLNSLAWLANHLGTRGLRLEAGEIVLTGSIPLPYWARAGESIEIEIERLGALQLTLA
jgi:2-keto-4-pentenoate hydratase